jgi:curli biogenesis system outer membrane secretion channel CsgG
VKKIGLIWIIVIAGLMGCATGAVKESAPVEKERVEQKEAPETTVKKEDTAAEKSGRESSAAVEKIEEFTGEPLRIGIRRFSVTNPDTELQSLGDDIPQTITETLVQSPYAAPLERQEFNALVEELKLSHSGMTDEEASLRAGKMLGAAYIMLGAFIQLGDQIKINARLVMTETGEIGFADSVRGGEDEIFDLPVRLAEKMVPYITEKAKEAE